jgi:prepilin-type N-terminal cleavage/methylation domain-containing protein
MMKSPSVTGPIRRRPGFTLVELLVVIAILAVLAAITFAVSTKLRARAEATKAFNHIRQSGMILLSDAQDKNNRLEFFSGGGSGGFEIRAYNIVRAYMGIERGRWNNQPANLIEMMHWNHKRVAPNNFHWNCFAVNFTNVSDFDVRWRIDNGRDDGSNARMLPVSTVGRLSAYPLLLDSSMADGSEIFRVGIVQTELPALRNAGKCHAFFLDGSARSLDEAGLKAAGFRTAYDTSETPPRLINL